MSFLTAAAIIYAVVFLSVRLVRIEKERLAEMATANISTEASEGS